MVRLIVIGRDIAQEITVAVIMLYVVAGENPSLGEIWTLFY